MYRSDLGLGDYPFYKVEVVWCCVMKGVSLVSVVGCGCVLGVMKGKPPSPNPTYT